MRGKNRRGSKAKSPSDYVEQAEAAWDQAWDIVHTPDDWRQEAGETISKGCVYSRHFQGLGKVFKLEAHLDASCDLVFDILVTGVLRWPEWNPTILECKSIEVINENTDIAYSVGANAVGGLVSSRDFVNLRHWKKKDGIMMSSACGAVHPDMPPVKHHVRAENKPACYVFKPIPGEDNKCHFICILNTELKGWMPQFLVDQALSGVLMDYLAALRVHIIDLKQEKTAESAETQTSLSADSAKTTERLSTSNELPNLQQETDCDNLKTITDLTHKLAIEVQS